MPIETGLFSAPEIAADWQVPVVAVRRTIDRLKLGIRVSGTRVVYSEDLDKLRIVFIAMGYEIPVSETLCRD